jgi:hypothetical protein
MKYSATYFLSYVSLLLKIFSNNFRRILEKLFETSFDHSLSKIDFLLKDYLRKSYYPINKAILFPSDIGGFDKIVRRDRRVLLI